MRRFFIAVLLGLHGVKFFTVFRKVDIFHGFPLINTDLVLYYVWIRRAHEFLESAGRIWGYDPYMSAGYVFGPILGIGTHFFAVVTFALIRWIPLETSLLYLELLSYFFMPFFLLPTVKNFGGSRSQGWLSFAFCTFIYGVYVPAQTVDVLTGSLFTFQVACFISFWQVSLLWKWIQIRSHLTWAIYTFVSCILFQIHPGSFFIVLFPSLLIYLGHFKGIKLQMHLQIISTCGLVLISNWYWIRPYWAFHHWAETLVYLETWGLKDLYGFLSPISLEMTGFISIVVKLLLILFFAEKIFQYFRQNKMLFIVFSSWFLVMVVIACYGSVIPFVEGIQPRRYWIAIWILIFIGAALSFNMSLKKEPRLTIIFSILIFGMVWPSKGQYKLNLLRYEGLTNVIPSEDMQVAKILSNEKFSKGRILFESADYNVAHFPGLVPVLSGQALIGENAPSTHLKTNYGVFSSVSVPFHYPVAFGRRLSDWGTDFYKKLDLYNVQTIVAKSEMIQFFLTAHSEIIRVVDSVPPYKIYSVEQKPNWFVKGSGEVTAVLDRIHIKNASSGELILKFHWIDTFRTNPALPIKPIHIEEDPLPFILIDNSSAVSEIVVYNAGF